MILDDASVESPFSADEYVRGKRARSVLCLPLMKQAKLIGVLYLENNLAAHVFTPARISLLELLASQAAISLENARLYGELTVSEERWRKLFESVPVGVNLVGSHRRYVAANPAFQRMTGYSEAELRGLSPADITHEDDRAASEAIIAANAAGEPYARRIEKRYRRKDGGVIVGGGQTPFWRRLRGARPSLAAVAVDVTERKRAEEALRDAQAELERTARLTTMGELTASIAHEINQPLAAIVTQSEAALRFLNRDEPDLDEVAGCAFPHRAGWHARGRRDPRPEGARQEIRTATDQARHRRRHQGSAGARPRRIAAPRRCASHRTGRGRTAGPGRSRSIAAGAFEPDHERRRSHEEVTDRARELTVSSMLSEPSSVLVAVKDMGTGLDPAVAERMFQPFFTTKRDGLGMGLAICRSIIESHGGRLWAAPRVPHGADIRFTIPLWVDTSTKTGRRD